MDPTVEALWVRWWCNPWSWAHPVRQHRFAESCGLTVGECDALMACRHSVFLESVGIAPAQPAVADTAVLDWLTLTPVQREQAIGLAQLICFTRYESDGPDGPWCWALAKALRPAVWLPADVYDARLLLGAWLGSQHWSRLRLAWPPGEVADVPCEAPENKLQTLWRAILWRVTAA
ncbi:Type III secretion protein HrpD [Pseudomonas caricapapayae]|uniref:Type III secretion protein HrpD n=1 Tax=Pseudomonas caricapapayae TaxID=46678 RepID=A0A0P9KGN0_9PSED|nr:hypothetical protein [Pseudomonas caricapapayae]KAA8695939.1 type III secretion protein [Pseudomonas caricapapayae]KPW55084.1 Type III secretion protein HrpD [Pseudomonas caricapapayae]RMM13539.1 Type III secretion protein HrpD [Pseudomonas caricapapayae]RMV70467.1 Type III secretion protein HrpD [Pseudomonas caricapapayae]RMV94694.1 Type III secretion protein HrpD [Pseudomonas caricapapayae]